MFTHIRTDYRLIPTADILTFGFEPMQPESGIETAFFIRDVWSDKFFKGADGFNAPKAEAARVRVAIKEAIATPHAGRFVRINPWNQCEVWHVDNGEAFDERFPSEQEARLRFDNLCEGIDALYIHTAPNPSPNTIEK